MKPQLAFNARPFPVSIAHWVSIWPPLAADGWPQVVWTHCGPCNARSCSHTVQRLTKWRCVGPSEAECCTRCRLYCGGCGVLSVRDVFTTYSLTVERVEMVVAYNRAQDRLNSAESTFTEAMAEDFETVAARWRGESSPFR